MTQGFEVRAAWGMGVVLPLLETLRRGTDFSNFHSYVDDWVAGARVLLAARAVSQGRPNGRAFLAAAWGVLCGALYAVALVALTLSIRRVSVDAQGGSSAR